MFFLIVRSTTTPAYYQLRKYVRFLFCSTLHSLWPARRSQPYLRYPPSQYRTSRCSCEETYHTHSLTSHSRLFTPHHPHLTNNHHRNQNKSLLLHQYYDWQRTIPVACHHNFHGCSWDGHFHRVMGHD